MPKLEYTLPSYAEPRIALSCTPSPVQEGPGPPDAFISGVKLIVSKLPHNESLVGAPAIWFRAHFNSPARLEMVKLDLQVSQLRILTCKQGEMSNRPIFAKGKGKA